MKRKLKITESGTQYGKARIPYVRLRGKWLEAAGFKPNTHLLLTVIAPGVIELRLEGQ